ncbi:MAG: type 1 glutamine amidotransferase [Rhizobiaceae bacterium]
MHIAILVTNTDRSEFARQNPRDPEMFQNLLSIHRPDWKFSVYDLTEDNYPDDLSGYDGVILTGSPASVNDDAPWVGKMLDLVRAIETDKIPMFGACFGHQAIAKALGGTVGYNPDGWQLGSTSTRFSGGRSWLNGAGEITLYAAHKEQVTGLPAEAEILSSSPQCAVGAFAVGDHVFATQYHPEMTPEFVNALIDEMSPSIDREVETRARQSLARQAENERFSAWVVAFFEQAAQPDR